MLATLNHPNIGAIYGLEQANSVPALVLELVEGETLAERIARRTTAAGTGLPIAGSISFARQIADALEAAHEKGIVHRDLKPANIKITPDGTVKVLDFGLAKATADGDARSDRISPTPTMTAPRERASSSGTAAYMSPEQAKGEKVDKRTDIWAFGCVLYEMLTGRRAVRREQPGRRRLLLSSTASRYGMRVTDRNASAVVRIVLERCLQKDHQGPPARHR